MCCYCRYACSRYLQSGVKYQLGARRGSETVCWCSTVRFVLDVPGRSWKWCINCQREHSIHDARSMSIDMNLCCHTVTMHIASLILSL